MSRPSSSRVPDVDPKSPAGAALTSAVQDKLRTYLGADYVDRSLAQYVVIMLAHKTGQQGVGDNLVEFLGEVDAREVASWLFENLQRLLEPAQHAERAREGQQQPADRQGTAEQRAGEGGTGADEGVELEMAASDGGGQRSASAGSDADTADAHGGGGGGGDQAGSDEGGSRRLASAVVRDQYGRRDERRGRSRSPVRRRSSPPPRRRHSPSPARRRRSPPRGAAYAWDGGTGARYYGHEPYPFRGGWRSPPRRRSPSPHGGRGHGTRHGREAPFADWQEGEWRRRDGATYRDDGWRRGRSPPPPTRGRGGAVPPWEPDGSRGGGGGGLRSAAHFEHDTRWEEEGAATAAAPHRYGSSGVPPPALASAVTVPGADGGLRSLAAADAAEPGLRSLAARASGPVGRQLPPWERPSYMDLEPQRQQRQQPAAQRQPSPPPGLGPPPAGAAAFGRVLAQAASAAAEPGTSGGSFQVTIWQGGASAAAAPQAGGGASAAGAPLLRTPGLHQLLQERLRGMELELRRLRAQQGEARLAAAQPRQELDAAARLDMTVRSVCIRGVHPAASDRVLIAHFGACGYIQRISHLRDPASGKRSGVAFMQFAAASQAQAALALDGSALLQRTIRVVPSDSPAARVAAARVLRAAQPSLVPLPVLAAPVAQPMAGRGRAGGMGRGASGRGGGSGRGRASFKYVRPADQPGPGAVGGAAAAAGGAAVDGGDHAMAD